MIIKLHGHIGSNATALVDGQLAPAEEERAWSHVLGCPGCRRLVQHEGSVKRRLAGLNGPDVAPSYLVGNLYDVDAWATVDEIERRSTRRRSAVMLMGAGSVGIAVLAFVAVSGAPDGRGELPGRGPTVGPARIGQIPARSQSSTGPSVGIEDVSTGRGSR